MKSIFVIAESMNYEKHFLFDYPLSTAFYNYLCKLYIKESKSKNEGVNNKKPLDNDFSYIDLYLKSFTLENHINQDFIFDIIIDNERFISFPIWFSKSEYNKRKKGEEEKEEYLKNKYYLKINTQSSNNILKNADKYILLNMFNIVLVFNNDEPMEKKQDLFKSVYSNLESLSKLLLFEEYNKHFLGIETERIIKIKKNYFNKKSGISKESFQKRFPKNNNIYKLIKSIYDGIENNEISHITVHKIESNYYISKYTNLMNGFPIKPYHCLSIIDRRKLNNFFKSAVDINPLILKIIDKIFEMKTLHEISLENNIELNFVLFFANQLVSWKLANIIFKFNNYSTFQITEKNQNRIAMRKNEKMIGFNQAISILNKFAISESTTTLNEIYQVYYKSTDNAAFIKFINILVESQHLVQTSIIIFSKLIIKSECNYKQLMINKFCDLTSHKNLFEDANINEIKDEDDAYYYEDFLKDIKSKNSEDFFILSLIKDFISQKLYVNEISYYTGIKIQDILNTVKKYEYIFDLVVVPLYNIKI